MSLSKFDAEDEIRKRILGIREIQEPTKPVTPEDKIIGKIHANWTQKAYTLMQEIKQEYDRRLLNYINRYDELLKNPSNIIQAVEELNDQFQKHLFILQIGMRHFYYCCLLEATFRAPPPLEIRSGWYIAYVGEKEIRQDYLPPGFASIFKQ